MVAATLLPPQAFLRKKSNVSWIKRAGRYIVIHLPRKAQDRRLRIRKLLTQNILYLIYASFPLRGGSQINQHLKGGFVSQKDV